MMMGAPLKNGAESENTIMEEERLRTLPQCWEI